MKYMNTYAYTSFSHAHTYMQTYVNSSKMLAYYSFLLFKSTKQK